MLELSQVNQLVANVVSTTLTGADLSRVMSEPTLDSSGEDALQITIVLRGYDDRLFNGSGVVDTLVEIIQHLQKSGDGRFPILSYATEEDLAQDDDPES
jgi:hypothetical protein